MDLGACIAPAGIDGAGVPECPAGLRGCARNLGGVGLEKVEFVDWAVVDGSTEEGEEHEESSTRYEDEGDEAEDGSCES